MHNVRASRYMAQPMASQLRDIGALIDAGKVKPFVSATFPLAEAAAALHTVEAGHAVGKVVLRMGD
jgi:NADPH:quinone reductase-like Zn-dependent oxidoreductase